MICQKCGSPMDDNAAFCFNCGHEKGVSLEKPFIPIYGKAPEFGKQLSTEDNLDPHYKKVDMAVGTLRWAFCILWIIECFKGNGIVLAIVMSALCVVFTSVMEKLVMFVYEYLRTQHFQNVKYSSYIDTRDSETIAHLLKEPLSACGIGVCMREKSLLGNIIDLEYQGREYSAAFMVGQRGSYFMILCGNSDKDSYEKMCKDVPFIVYHIQDVLKNL